jgi:hypothetical protein
MPLNGQSGLSLGMLLSQYPYRCHDKETPPMSFSFEIEQDLRRKKILHFKVFTLLLPYKKG